MSTPEVADCYAVAQMLLGIGEQDPFLESGVIVLAAGMYCGARNRALQQFTGLPARTINTASYWLRESGIWRGDAVYAPWREDDEPADLRHVAFVMHAMVAAGDLRSTDGGITFELRRPGQAVNADADPPDWTDALRDEAAAYQLLEAARWPTGQPDACPYCGRRTRFYYLAPRSKAGRLTRTGRATARRIWKCASCRRQFSVLTGTPLQSTKLPLRVVVSALAEQVTAPGSVTQATLVRRYRLRPDTANRLLELTGHAATAAHPLAALTAGPAS